jgi:choice-of-anchor B domain-containing protein
MKVFYFVLILLSLNIQLWGQTNYGMSSVANLPYTQELSSLWGWKSASGTEYALVGTTTGTSIVSLANPANPVQVQFIPGANTIWREIKTYGNYGYVACDNCSEGLLIIDLSTLPGAVNHIFYKPRLTVNGDTDTLRSIHTLYVEGNYLYLAGTNLNAGETIIMDLTNPWAPQKVGNLPNTYAHDIFVRGDTIWAANIYDGYFSIYDITNKATPVYLGNQTTPNNFTHNVWISSDGNTIFSTDERANAYVAAYNVSDLSNIIELDRWQTFETRGSGVIPHNVHVLNDYVVVSYYTDGVVILDGSRPSNLVEVARYDTYLQTNQGFYGCWGVYPYFQSGLIAASDINTGLHIMQPNYQRACWLEGNVTDTLSNAPLGNVLVEINTTAIFDNSVLNGDYKTGYGIAGTYNVTYSRPGYYPKTISVNLQHGVVNLQNVQLRPMIAFAFTGRVVDADNANAPVANAKVMLESPTFNYNVTTDASGNFTVPAMFQDNYSIYAGKWGYKTVLQNSFIEMSSTAPIIPINRGYRDEFILDLGWTVSGNASTGAWEREVSEELLFNSNPATPNEDLAGDIGNKCFITGANNAGSLSQDDIDGGNTILRSPNFDLTSYIEPFINYNGYFIAIQGNGTPNDSMIVKIYNGTTSAVLSIYNTPVYSWRAEALKISDFITPTANMRIEVEAFDKSPGHLVEAAFDLFEIVENGAVANTLTASELVKFSIYPNPFVNTFNIDIDDSDGLIGQEIRMLDNLGRLIHSQQISKKGIQQITVSDKLPNGIYILNIGGKTAKLIKMK